MWLLAAGATTSCSTTAPRYPASRPLPKPVCADVQPVTPRTPDCTGTAFTPPDIQAAVRRHEEAVRACYDGALGRDENAGGRVTMRFVLEKDGQVTNACAVDTAIADLAMLQCMAEELAKIEVPGPPAVACGSTKVVYPFVFMAR
jgi:hypothetical protein